MIVRCVKLYDPILHAQVNKNHWLTVGKTYFVLEVLAREEFTEYRLFDDRFEAGNPGVYRMWQFEVIDPRIPSNWQTHQEAPNSLIMGPEQWQQPNFWECFYERNCEEEDIFNQEVKKMYQELGHENQIYR